MLVDVRKLKQGANVVDIVDKALRMGEGHQLKKLENVAKAVNALEDEISALSDEELKGQTAKFKQRLDNGENLDKLMPEAFATVREVSKRTLGQRHFDVQLMGGAALHWGNIAEMKTGEGKTLVATLPSYLNALEGKGVHVVTVNDYLASYQSELMGRIYRFLGMNVGCIITDQKPADKKPETKETPEERLERLKAKAEEKMEETTPYLSDGFSADEMYKAMLSRGKLENRPEMAWKPIKDKL